MAKHALLAPSGASRWMVCTKSARACEGIPNTSSTFADEGSQAHRYAETVLKGHEPVYSVSDEMKRETARYIELIEEKSCIADVVALEQRYDLREYIPDCAGTADATIITGDVLEIVDLKYGLGVKVEAEGNKQMRIYALGALSAYKKRYKINTVRMTIAQVRLDHIVTEEMTTAELLEWAETELKPKAKMAYEGAGDFVPGDACRWCLIKATCRARTEMALESAKLDFKKPDTLDDDEIAEVLKKAKMIAEWSKDVWEYAENAAINDGKNWPGWKVVAKKSKRRFKDTGMVRAILELEEIEFLREPELKPITELEKMLGKKRFNELLKNQIEKPDGAPELAPEDDKREAWNKLERAKNDFGACINE